jgi:hypothetical protein
VDPPTVVRRALDTSLPGASRWDAAASRVAGAVLTRGRVASAATRGMESAGFR